MKRLREIVQKARDKMAEPPYAGCWACSMNRCHLAPGVDGTCGCCRNGHVR